MGLMLWQDKHALDIIYQTSMSSYRHVDTLISTSKVTAMSDFLFSGPTCFWQIIGAL